PVRRLAGECEVPGDKSISHRAALLGAIADGPTEVQGYLEGEDCLRTLTAIQMMGVEVGKKGPGHYRIGGVGRDGLSEPGDVVDCGNSGTTARLLIGFVAGQPFWTLMTGDESLRRRPMKRVAEPLTRMGATIVGREDGGRLPLAVRGASRPRAISYTTPMASAQVKSAILLAGLRADGPVTVREPAPSRDHSEVMLRAFGARVERTDPLTVTLHPGPLRGAAVLRVKESDRIAMLARELAKMGVRIDERADGLAVPGGQRFHGARVASAGDHRMAMALAVAALVADGETVIEDTACVQTSFPTFVDTLNALAGGEAITVEP